MAQELDALARNKIWSLVPVSEASNIVGCKWIFKTKHRSYGTVEDLKQDSLQKNTLKRKGSIIQTHLVQL